MAKLKLGALPLFQILVQWVKVRLWLRVDAEFVFGSGFLTWHRRPKRTLKLETLNPILGQSDIGIVIQGPILRKFGFTSETVRRYRRLYPNAQIVVSTWAGVPDAFSRLCTQLGVSLIENSEVSNPYYGNLTRQQITSVSGLDLLMDKGVRFAVKVRTDQRLYSKDFLEQLDVAMKMFPAVSMPGRSSPFRIFLTYQNSFVDRQLSGSDFMQFGSIEDLLAFWKSLDNKSISRELASEQILLASYLTTLGWAGEELITPSSWTKAMKHVVGFIDSYSIDLFWVKYSSREYLWRRYGKEPLEEVSPRHWYSAMLDL